MRVAVPRVVFRAADFRAAVERVLVLRAADFVAPAFFAVDVRAAVFFAAVRRGCLVLGPGLAPPSCLFTVAQARRSASFFGTPRAS